jgi:hypothetical protein
MDAEVSDHLFDITQLLAANSGARTLPVSALATDNQCIRVCLLYPVGSFLRR